ncbi:dTDP-4-dehydrorhamnose reductase [Mycolicibacterium murale]|uniref:dTDP-4-dehydrorhamnose reductase n=1 Tax=Mycolicibacterium murale TaxID=182220 RepID=A0A7I9WUP4_9MYCO|nr:dTDP-4-dehydrorhamnose reductase [Mycolicibacterium murale]MCV7185740.1 dTDP-4-dehydrorhamnose reductase [Mycolicibacterium murale]GFG61393.1 dTDP-4-dehydrorhamnose reductase [Mycolicibacterium murale]
MTHYGKGLRIDRTPIPGLLILELTVHGDNRGWFKENWQREKMTAAGLPDFEPVQHNISFNDAVGTTRGIHAEPWDKYISVATGRVFGAWVDLRDGPTFGTVFTMEIDSSRAIFVPRGVGNSFQTLEPNTAYTYLVNDHYSPQGTYCSVNLADKTLAIKWPIPLELAELSAKDRAHPSLAAVQPVLPRKILILGANGQLGRALRGIYEGQTNVEYADRSDIDLSSSDFSTVRRWHDYDTVINAAAYTSVDEAESYQGRRTAWDTNVRGVAQLAQIATACDITLVHVSSDYVFDGQSPRPYSEADPVCPLGVYGQTKAAGDAVAATVKRHYIVRTSWVIGDGKNFVRTMLSLADRGVYPSVVNDQYGRLTFAPDLAAAIQHILRSALPYGVYNVTGDGPVMSWVDIARHIFSDAGHDPNRIRGVSSKDYASEASQSAKRPSNSTLDLSKITSTWKMHDSSLRLSEYVHSYLA